VSLTHIFLFRKIQARCLGFDLVIAYCRLFFPSQNNEKEFQPSAKLRVSSFLSFGFFFGKQKCHVLMIFNTSNNSVSMSR